MKKRFLAGALALMMCLCLLPTAAWAASSLLQAKPWYSNPNPGNATPASQSGATAAVPYQYSEVSLHGANNSWFIYDGAETITFEAVYMEPAGITNYGEVSFSDTAPYITYTPSAEVANQTVKFKVKATAGTQSATGNFYWTVNVGSQPTDASNNTKLTSLTYQIEGGASGSITLEDGKTEYEVILPYGTKIGQTITLSGETGDTNAKITKTTTARTEYSYVPGTTATLTVLAENGATTATYEVDFRVDAPGITSSVLIDGIAYTEDGTAVLTLGSEEKMRVTFDVGDTGEGAAYYTTGDRDIVGLQNYASDGYSTGAYPGNSDYVDLDINGLGETDITIKFFDSDVGSNVNTAVATKTIKIHVIVTDITGILLDRQALSLDVGESDTLAANIMPGDHTDKTTIEKIVWSSSNESVATVDQNGRVTAVAPGTAQIYATDAPHGTWTGFCTVTVDQPVTDIYLDWDKLSLTPGDTAKLTATVEPSNATDKRVSWTSSDESVATVDQSGKVTAVAPGTATITVTTQDGSKTATCAVTVTQPVTGIALDKEDLSLTVGGTYTLIATVQPDNATDKTVTWTSSDESVATVDNGKITAVGVGTATITAAAGGYTATCEVNVAWPYVPPTDPSYAITVTDTANGTVTVSPRSAREGQTVTVTVTPDEGYKLASLTVTDRLGNSVRTAENADGTFSFTMPASQVTVTATFQVVEVDEPDEPTPWTDPFVDVAASDWYYSAVEYVCQNGLMVGTSAVTFEPAGTVTRGTMMTILARLDGTDTAGSDPWYQAGLIWAVSAGVSDGTDPEGTITREQVAAMLYRYAGSPAVTGNYLNGFADATSVSDWAVSAMNWAVSVGILQGGDNGLAPQGTATRAELAAMLMRFCENAL